MSSYLRQHCYAVSFFLLVIIAVASISVRPKSRVSQVFAGAEGGAKDVVQQQTWAQGETDEEIKQPANFFVSEDERSYLGYTVERSSRKGLLYSGENGSRDHYVDVKFVTVRKAGKVIGIFDADLYFGPGNSADFGFFRFLDNRSEQLFISQDIYRGGNQWIVTLSPRFRVLFNGGDWTVGREAWDVEAVDIDKDGIYEVIAPTCIFYGFANLSPAGTPLPNIVFKYSKKSGRYLPANPQFADYLLAKVEDQKKEIRPIGDPVENHNHLSDVLTIVLDYVFAGRQNEAWTFFDEAYKLPNKNRVKKEVQSELKSSPVYRFIYRRKSKA